MQAANHQLRQPVRQPSSFGAVIRQSYIASPAWAYKRRQPLSRCLPNSLPYSLPLSPWLPTTIPTLRPWPWRALIYVVRARGSTRLALVEQPLFPSLPPSLSLLFSLLTSAWPDGQPKCSVADSTSCLLADSAAERHHTHTHTHTHTHPFFVLVSNRAAPRQTVTLSSPSPQFPTLLVASGPRG